MTEPADLPTAAVPHPAENGEPTGVEAAIRDLDTLSERPLTEHHDRLARAHDVLRQALTNGSGPGEFGAGEPGRGEFGRGQA